MGDVTHVLVTRRTTCNACRREVRVGVLEEDTLMNQDRIVILEKIEKAVWRASLEGADHIGGIGTTPEEALGWLCLNHPQRMGIGEFRWEDPPPRLPGHPAEVYPEGVQESFG